MERRKKMHCPFKMANPELASKYDPMGCYSSQDWECSKENCELWNEHFGRCSFAVGAYIKAHEDYLKEKRMEVADGE